MNPATRQVWRGEAEIQLSAKEFALLETFMRRPGEVLSQYQLLEHAWDYDYENRSNVVEVYVRYLREKIDRPFGVESLETVRGAGYRLRPTAVASVSRLPIRRADDRGVRAGDGGGAGCGAGLFVYVRLEDDLDEAIDAGCDSRATARGAHAQSEQHPRPVRARSRTPRRASRRCSTPDGRLLDATRRGAAAGARRPAEAARAATETLVSSSAR